MLTSSQLDSLRPRLLNQPSQTCASNRLRQPQHSPSSTTIRASLALTTPHQDRHRRIPGTIHRIGSLQSPFNPHTSTALAA